MTKPELEGKLHAIIQNYKLLHSTLNSSKDMLKRNKMDSARDLIEIVIYRTEQIQIQLETTVRELELQRKINNYHDTRYNEE